MRGVAVTGAGRAGAHVLGAAALRKRWRRVGGVRALFDRAGRAWAVAGGRWWRRYPLVQQARGPPLTGRRRAFAASLAVGRFVHADQPLESEMTASLFADAA
jgi:hypothetical protein